jgi:hypothetical protein
MMTVFCDDRVNLEAHVRDRSFGRHRWNRKLLQTVAHSHRAT